MNSKNLDEKSSVVFFCAEERPSFGRVKDLYHGVPSGLPPHHFSAKSMGGGRHPGVVTPQIPDTQPDDTFTCFMSPCQRTLDSLPYSLVLDPPKRSSVAIQQLHRIVEYLKLEGTCIPPHCTQYQPHPYSPQRMLPIMSFPTTSHIRKKKHPTSYFKVQAYNFYLIAN